MSEVGRIIFQVRYRSVIEVLKQIKISLFRSTHLNKNKILLLTNE
jgi:hypothetical protein